MITSGNRFISLMDENENRSWCFFTFFLEAKSEEIIAAARMSAAIWNRILYVTSRPSSNTDPSSGPAMNPITKNIVNHEMCFTLFFSELSFEIIA
jgi:hypothetical protein